MDALIQELRAYAKQQVDENRSRILANLQDLPLVLDVALPGAAYFSVAAGGLAEVLHLLGEEVVQVDRFIGASGGACSLFLIVSNQPKSSGESSGDGLTQWVSNLLSAPLATGPTAGPSQCPDSELLLRSYLQYGESEGKYAATRCFSAVFQNCKGVSHFWAGKYREILRNDASWQAIQDKAYVAVSAKPLRSKPKLAMKAMVGMKTQKVPSFADDKDGSPRNFEAPSDNYVFHQFDNKEQAVQAFVATGEATYKGFRYGINIVDAEDEDDKAKKEEPRSKSDGSEFRLSMGSKAVSISRSLPSNEKSSPPLKLPPTYCDGGSPVSFIDQPDVDKPSERRNATLYYHTFFNNGMDALYVTQGSVRRLFKRGVDRTIDCLCSPSFASPEPSIWAASDKMVIARNPADFGKIGMQDTFGKKKGTFVNVRSRSLADT